MHSKTFILTITGLLLFTSLSAIVNSSLSESKAKEWEIVRQPRITHIYDIQFMDAQNGYATMLEHDDVLTHRTTIHRTFDGGITWTPQYWAKTSIGSLDFVDVNTRWAVGGDGTIVHTEDGGETWQTQESGTKTGLVKVDFITKSTGWIVGEFGVILHTEDGGATWNAQDSGFQQHLRSLSFVDEKNGWAVGDSGTILHTKDGGKRWERQSSGTDTTLFDVSFTNEKVGWAVGGGVIIHTEDSGATWNIQKNEDRMQGLRSSAWGEGVWQLWRPSVPNYHSNFHDVHFVDAQHGWVVGRSIIGKTEDGGATWTLRYLENNDALYGVQFTSLNIGYAVGYRAAIDEEGIILRTDDGGENWSETKLGLALCGLCFVSDTKGLPLSEAKGWVVGIDEGEQGIILHTDDGGENWSVQYKGGNELSWDLLHQRGRGMVRYASEGKIGELKSHDISH